MQEFIYHILDEAAWNAAADEAFYVHPSFEKEAFIHFSYLHQLESTANRYFTSRDQIKVAIVNVQKLGTAVLLAEPSTAGELFPHLYGELAKSAIEKLVVIQKQPEGFRITPEELL